MQSFSDESCFASFQGINVDVLRYQKPMTRHSQPICICAFLVSNGFSGDQRHDPEGAARATFNLHRQRYDLAPSGGHLAHISDVLKSGNVVRHEFDMSRKVL